MIEKALALVFDLSTAAMLKGIILQGLNSVTLLGAVFVKAPQLLAIWKNQSVGGLSEATFVWETISHACGTGYNVLQGHPFATWGELAFLVIQCNLQVLMFWKFAEPALNLTPRMIGAVMYCILFSVLLFLGKYLPADFVPFLGMIPTAIGTSSRLPQIYMNFKQQHTGNLSFITWFLSLGGNIVRVITTLSLIHDPVQLAGHSIALVQNLVLVLQITFFWKASKKFLADERKKRDAAASKKKK